MDKDQLDLVATVSIIAGALLLIFLLRRHARAKQKPVSPRQHEMRFDDAAIRQRIEIHRTAKRVPRWTPIPTRSAPYHQKERPPER